MKNVIKSLKRSSIVKFVLVGICSTGIDFVIYMLLSSKIPITISKGISMIVTSFFSYFLNKKFTFRNKRKTNLCYLIRYYIVFVANIGSNMIVNYFVFKNTGYRIVAFILATLCGMIVNYIGQRFFVFNGDL